MNPSCNTYNAIPPSSSRSNGCQSSSCHDDHDEHTPLLRQRTTQSSSSTFDEQPLPKHEIDSSLYTLSLAGLIERASLSVYLENKGSVARDHLANERTYLAWLRTSLSLISVGVALTQLFRLDKKHGHGGDSGSSGLEELLRSGRFVGLMFVVMGILFVLFAISRYFHAQQAMIKGFFPASRGIVLLASSSVTIAVIILFMIIVR